MTDGEPRAELPPRNPRTLFVHFAVDTAVAFLATVLVLLMLDVSIWIAAVIAVIVGIIAAPFTRRAEERGLERRHAIGGGSPSV